MYTSFSYLVGNLDDYSPLSLGTLLNTWKTSYGLVLVLEKLYYKKQSTLSL